MGALIIIISILDKKTILILLSNKRITFTPYYSHLNIQIYFYS